MTPTQKSAVERLILAFLIPVLVAAMALGGARVELNKKEDAASHVQDIRTVEAMHLLQATKDSNRYDELKNLVLDMRCDQRPSDRRCMAR